MQDLEKTIKKLLISALKESDFTDVEVEEISLEVPSNKNFGDYSTNIAMKLAKEKRLNPLEIAGTVAGKIKKDSLIEKVEAVKPGFINFYLTPAVYLSQLNEILTQKESYGSNDYGEKRTVVVEYGSPNIGKPLTIGHLRSLVIGDSLARILEVSNFNVKRDDHLGDWGAAFGKQLASFEEYKVNLEDLKASNNPIELLVELYIRFNADSENNKELVEKGRNWFKKLEEGDPIARERWKLCVDISLKELNRILTELMIKPFTENGGEGFGEAYFETMMPGILQKLKEANLERKIDYHQSDGAWLVFFPNNEIPPLMILKSNGTTLYATRDLATDDFRLKHYNDSNLIVINEVGIEQLLYLRQLYRLEELLGWYKKEQRIHIAHGLFRLKEGKMSTRKGNVIWLKDVINDVILKAKKLSKEGEDEATIKKIGIGALKWNDLKRDPKQDIIFDKDEVLNLKGNSGPYMQYTYVRGINILKTIKKDTKIEEIPEKKLSSDELDLLKELTRYPSIVIEAAKNYAPSFIPNYLYTVAQKFNNFYEKSPVLNEEDPALKNFRINLVKASTIVLKNGLNLLGIEVVDRM